MAERKENDGSLTLLQGTLDLLILQALAWGQMHGYGISRIIRDRTNEVLLVEDAALYQSLHRLERKGCIEAEWGVSDNNRRAKYYALTPAGRRLLRRQADQWRRYASAVSAVLDPA
jgi:transcriptional regulator